jgi:hypothetical protein
LSSDGPARVTTPSWTVTVNVAGQLPVMSQGKKPFLAAVPVQSHLGQEVSSGDDAEDAPVVVYDGDSVDPMLVQLCRDHLVRRVEPDHADLGGHHVFDLRRDCVFYYVAHASIAAGAARPARDRMPLTRCPKRRPADDGQPNLRTDDGLRVTRTRT